MVTFTRHIDLGAQPRMGLIHLSADTRYKLFINKKRVAVGPSRGSQYIWYYDSVDISSYLQQGRNEIQIVVLRYFAANRAAMPFARTSFPGLTVFGAIDSGVEAVEICTKQTQEWRAKVHNEVQFPTGSIDDGFLHVRLGPACRKLMAC